MEHWIRPLLDLLFPRACVGCARAMGDVDPGHICWDCRSQFPLITDEYCESCGDPIEGRAGGAFECSSCVRRAPHFQRARSAARYRGPLRTALHAFKYGQFTALAEDLAALLEGCVRTHFDAVHFDGVLAVPLHAAKQRQRTYNQSALLAQGLGRRLGLANLGRQVERLRPTHTQTRLSAAERRRNVHGAFRVREPGWIEGRRLLVVDDVMTTGATVDECARVLREAGAAGVFVATVARG